MIRDRDRLATTAARETALDCIEAGIAAADPERAVRASVALDGDRLRIGDEEYDLADYGSVFVLGGGKAADRMAAALDRVLGDRIDDGVVVTDDPADAGSVEVRAASHPVPDERGVEATRAVQSLADRADGDALVLVVLSGGGSALLPAPANGIELADLRTVTAALLDAGAPIADVNAVRKHCSAIKGGQLARSLAPATVVTLAVSDVVGDDPCVIASGPTAGDPTTYAEARAVLDRVGIDPPPAVVDHLDAGAAGDRPETPTPGDPVVERVAYHVVASGRTALAAAREAAIDRGYDALVLGDRIRGEAREAARTHAGIAESILAGDGPLERPAVVLSGGETTVTVRGDGRGGPNAEFALAAGVEFADGPPVAGVDDVGGRIALASVDTDGRDGPTGGDPTPAGGLVDGTTVDDPAAARRALAENDAHGYLGERDALVVTGPTGTNVDDLRVVVVA